MASITLTELKEWLHVDHSLDDNKLSSIILASEQWAENFTGRNTAEVSASSSSETIDESYKLGIKLYAQMLYDATPAEHAVLLKAAQGAIFASRCNLGI